MMSYQWVYRAFSHRFHMQDWKSCNSQSVKIRKGFLGKKRDKGEELWLHGEGDMSVNWVKGQVGWSTFCLQERNHEICKLKWDRKLCIVERKRERDRLTDRQTESETERQR